MDTLVIELPNFFSKKSDKRFVLNDEGLLIMNDARPDHIVEIPIEQIQSFRFDVSWIRGYCFPIGRRYIIEIKDRENDIIPIKFSSYYGIRKKAYFEAYGKLVQGIWDHYFQGQFQHFLNLYNLKLPFELNNLKLSESGISWEKQHIPWDNLAISKYRTYFVLHHANNHKIQRSFSFKNDWNAFLLQALVITLKSATVKQHS